MLEISMSQWKRMKGDNQAQHDLWKDGSFLSLMFTKKLKKMIFMNYFLIMVR